jgi:hypothetical protein
VLQSVVLWKLWRQSDDAEALGEINGLVPSGTYFTSIWEWSHAYLGYAVGIQTRRFASDPAFDPLNASDPDWLRVMPCKLRVTKSAVVISCPL